MSRKKISIITPTYNREDCIMDAIDSVINQEGDYFDYEIIISDDGSTDGTKKLFQKINNPKIKYFWHKNEGVNSARNKAIKKATGDLILLLDSDDTLETNTFKTIKKELENLKEINFFGTKEKKSGKKMYCLKNSQTFSYKDWLEEKKIKGEFLSVIKKNVFKIDMFDEERFCFESFFWNRVIKKYGVNAFDIPLRIYSFEQTNRVSKQLLNPQKAKKRYEDYIEYLKRFESDYRKYNLNKKISDIYLTTGYYALASNQKNKGIFYLKKSLKLHKNIKNIGAITLAIINKKLFLKIANLNK